MSARLFEHARRISPGGTSKANFTAPTVTRSRPYASRVRDQLARAAFAASTTEEIALARLLVARVSGVELIRFGNSGTA